MTSAIEQEKLERAAAGYARYQLIRSVVSILFWIALLVVAVVVGIQAGWLWGIGTLVVGSPVGAFVFGWLLMLPLGYLFCGRDAMTLGRQIEKAKMERERR